MNFGMNYAIFNMIMKLDEEKWYNPTEHSAP